MKRSQFAITSNAGHNVIKSTWNAAIRETERLIKETARADGFDYSLVDKLSVKSGDDFGFVSGFRKWERADGQYVLFTILKIA